MKREKGAEKKLLLDLLNQWSIRHDLAGDPYLNSIVRTIENEGSLALWSELDPEVHLPRPISNEGTPFIRAARIVAILRNALVFLPVALTWKAVSEATSAFSEFVRLNNAAPVNFLEFWQNGYGVLDSKWKIAAIAEIDFWIIILIIIMTLFATFSISYGQDRDLRAQEELDKERQVVVFEIKSFLLTPDISSPSAVDESLRSSLRNLNAAAQSIASAAAKLERSLMGQNKNIVENQEVSREFKSFQKKILKVMKQSEK